MQDIGAWLTHWEWNATPGPSARIVRCADGHAVVEGAEGDLPAGLDRAGMVARAIAAGAAAAPVRAVDEVLADGPACGVAYLPERRAAASAGVAEAT